MKDLENRADIEFLVNAFYTKVQKDETIGFFFNDVAKTNWNYHLPKMYDFWETLLFGQRLYKGNPMASHLPVNWQVPMEKHHFDHWVKLWTETVRDHFQGENADMAIYKAQNIAELMSYKMQMATRLQE